MTPSSGLSRYPRLRSFLDGFRAAGRQVSLFVLGVAIVSAVVALVLPQWFVAEATLLPPQETSENIGVMASLIQSAALSKVGLFTTQTPSDVFAEILRSRTLREDLIRAFSLEKTYRAPNMDVALKRMESHLSVEVNKAGLILVRVEDRNAKRAAEMANFLLDRLDRFNRETYSTHAKRVRIFLEERLADVVTHMSEAESTLTAYEKRNKIIASDKAAVEGVADVMAQRLSLQIKRAYVSSYTRGYNPALEQIDAQMAAYERELAKMPTLKQEGERLALESELQRRLFTLITAQYEEARVQEARDTPTITVLDRARQPDLRARPKRVLIVAISSAVALLLAMAWVALRLPDPKAT